MDISKTTITLALGFAAVSLNAHAQTNQGVQPAASPADVSPGATSPAATTSPGATSPSAATPGSATPADASPNAMQSNPQRAESQANNASGDQSQLNGDDRQFLENAIQGSHAEVEGSKLALEKTENPDVRQFAEKMIEDHEAMIKETTTLANNKGVEPPDGPSILQTAEVTALRALTGGAFDSMYVSRIGVASHESTIELFEEASNEAQDPEVKAMISETLPKLREHLEMARKLDEKLSNQ